MKWESHQCRYTTRILNEFALGEVWFFPNTSGARYREARLDPEDESTYFTTLCDFLCFDYDMIMSGCVQKLCDWICAGVEMPATIFMEIYRRGRKVDPADRFRLRRDFKYLGFLEFGRCDML